MVDVYSNYYVNIAASYTDSSYGGYFQSRPAVFSSPYIVTIRGKVFAAELYNYSRVQDFQLNARRRSSKSACWRRGPCTTKAVISSASRKDRHKTWNSEAACHFGSRSGRQSRRYPRIQQIPLESSDYHVRVSIAVNSPTTTMIDAGLSPQISS